MHPRKCCREIDQVIWDLNPSNGLVEGDARLLFRCPCASVEFLNSSRKAAEPLPFRRPLPHLVKCLLGKRININGRVSVDRARDMVAEEWTYGAEGRHEVSNDAVEGPCSGLIIIVQS